MTCYNGTFSNIVLKKSTAQRIVDKNNNSLYILSICSVPCTMLVFMIISSLSHNTSYCPLLGGNWSFEMLYNWPRVEVSVGNKWWLLKLNQGQSASRI